MAAPRSRPGHRRHLRCPHHQFRRTGRQHLRLRPGRFDDEHLHLGRRELRDFRPGTRRLPGVVPAGGPPGPVRPRQAEFLGGHRVPGRRRADGHRQRDASALAGSSPGASSTRPGLRRPRSRCTRHRSRAACGFPPSPAPTGPTACRVRPAGIGSVSAQFPLSFRQASGVEQYAYSKTEYSEADLVSITADQTTTVDNLLPTGSIAGRVVTADGQPLANVEVSAQGRRNVTVRTDTEGRYRFAALFSDDCRVAVRFASGATMYAPQTLDPGKAGVYKVVAGQEIPLDITMLPTGTVNGRFTTHAVHMSASGYHSVDGRPVTITAGGQTQVEFSLVPMGTVEVTVVDAATGAPVADTCITPHNPKRVTARDGCMPTDAGGKVALHLGTGDYSLMAFPSRESGYGIQWVGPAGGTGDSRRAAVLKVVDGQRTIAPIVRLDRGGTISGRVTSETGQPLRFATVGLIGYSDSHGGGFGAGYPIEADGRYTIEGVGPYRWPLMFEAQGHANQWSGTKPSRFRADPVPVTAGATTTHNHIMRTGTLITGMVKDRDGNRLFDSDIRAYAPDTGDTAAGGWVLEGQFFEIRLLSPSFVKVSYDYGRLWFLGTSLEHSGVFPVGRGRGWLGMCQVSDRTLVYCLR